MKIETFEQIPVGSSFRLLMTTGAKQVCVMFKTSNRFIIDAEGPEPNAVYRSGGTYYCDRMEPVLHLNLEEAHAQSKHEKSLTISERFADNFLIIDGKLVAVVGSKGETESVIAHLRHAVESEDTAFKLFI